MLRQPMERMSRVSLVSLLHPATSSTARLWRARETRSEPCAASRASGDRIFGMWVRLTILTCMACLSASEKTATVLIPSLRQVRMILTAISPLRAARNQGRSRVDIVGG